ncbi:hypothetical protein Goshw_002090 [Gossypium schwendimanii]|uniref:Uncharacterized protein n=1 Tax=Gossypium schwendimanii TaxID=34291 RepID=A0A7J9MFZ0_GOSSC|nr:hypothetical protein [Gossypium schwendimanii]
MDAHQWNQVEDYSEGRTSMILTSSDNANKSRQHRPLPVPNVDHLQQQQQQAPAMVASSEGYPSKDDDSESDGSFESSRKSEKDCVSNDQRIFEPKPQQPTHVAEKCDQSKQSLPSVAAQSPPKEGERSSPSFNQPQQWQTSDRVNPPTRHPSGSTSQSSHSAVPMKAHSNTGYTRLPSVEAPSARVPLKVDPIPMSYNPRPPYPDEEGMAYRGETTVPKDEITPATTDSIEASPKNVAVKRKTSPPPSSSPPCCCIS